MLFGILYMAGLIGLWIAGYYAAFRAGHYATLAQVYQHHGEVLQTLPTLESGSRQLLYLITAITAHDAYGTPHFPGRLTRSPWEPSKTDLQRINEALA